MKLIQKLKMTHASNENCVYTQFENWGKKT